MTLGGLVSNSVVTDGSAADASTAAAASNLTVKGIAVTDLRRNPAYTKYYNNWTRLLLNGIIPFILLIYFNYKVRVRFPGFATTLCLDCN